MKCTVCNGRGNFLDARQRFDCFVCGGSGQQSMSFWGETQDEGNMEGQEHRLHTGKVDSGDKKNRKHRSSSEAY